MTIEEVLNRIEKEICMDDTWIDAGSAVIGLFQKTSDTKSFTEGCKIGTRSLIACLRDVISEIRTEAGLKNKPESKTERDLIKDILDSVAARQKK